ncbi:hypothetical protein [Ornithinimicrobium kibberense]|uniref:hypothetical protein n=1 Tax=Ornithinimicrobium kibberense TaxID=282060 RepID=UPI00360DF280
MPHRIGGARKNTSRRAPVVQIRVGTCVAGPSWSGEAARSVTMDGGDDAVPPLSLPPERRPPWMSGPAAPTPSAPPSTAAG